MVTEELKRNRKVSTSASFYVQRIERRTGTRFLPLQKIPCFYRRTLQTVHEVTLQMTRNRKESPAKLALPLGMFVSVATAIWIYDALFFESDDRLKIIFIIIAVFGTSYAHNLIYRRVFLRTLREELLSLGILVAGFSAGIWLSFAYWDGDSIMGDLTIAAALFVAWGVDSLVGKWL